MGLITGPTAATLIGDEALEHKSRLAFILAGTGRGARTDFPRECGERHVPQVRPPSCGAVLPIIPSAPDETAPAGADWGRQFIRCRWGTGASGLE